MQLVDVLPRCGKCQFEVIVFQSKKKIPACSSHPLLFSGEKKHILLSGEGPRNIHYRMDSSILLIIVMRLIAALILLLFFFKIT